jgi:DNA-binding MarR family transcriptional regulator
VSGHFAERRHVAGIVSRLARSLTVTLDRNLEDAGLSFAQYLVLVRLWRAQPAALSQVGLSADLAIERSSLTTLLQSLERAGFIERRTEHDDRRRLAISLTPEGAALEGQVLEIVDAYEEALLSDFTGDERDELRAALEVLQGRAYLLRDLSLPRPGETSLSQAKHKES